MALEMNLAPVHLVVHSIFQHGIIYSPNALPNTSPSSCLFCFATHWNVTQRGPMKVTTASTSWFSRPLGDCEVSEHITLPAWNWGADNYTELFCTFVIIPSHAEYGAGSKVALRYSIHSSKPLHYQYVLSLMKSWPKVSRTAAGFHQNWHQTPLVNEPDFTYSCRCSTRLFRSIEAQLQLDLVLCCVCSQD